MRVLQKVEVKIAEDGRQYWELPKLKDKEYYSAKLKRGGFIKVTGGEPYMSKDKFFYMNFDIDKHDVLIVKED